MKAQTGRPKSNNPMDIRYSVRLDADTESQLHAYCERTNITRGEAVRLGIKLLLSLKKERLEHECSNQNEIIKCDRPFQPHKGQLP